MHINRAKTNSNLIEANCDDLKVNDIWIESDADWIKANSYLIDEMDDMKNVRFLLSWYWIAFVKNASNARFFPHLEEAIEKNRVLRIINYKDHINKVLGKRLNIYWRKLLK
jgi:hypothetical protein